MLDSLPPNDPNRNGGNGRDSRYQPTKEDSSQAGGERNSAPIEVFGNMEDSPMVVLMFLVGVATWFLRERCIC
jgi:hypothetical protein